MKTNNDIQIIATIDSTYTSPNCEVLSHLIENNINYFRFNLSKYSNIDEIQKRCEYINLVKQRYGSDVRLMLDMPIPRRKARIKLYGGNREIMLRAGEIFRISPKQSNFFSDVSYIDDKDILSRLTEGTIVKYSDGECRFSVLEIDQKQEIIALKVENDFKIYTHKSISYGHTIKDTSLEAICVQVVDCILPESVAFSFVNSVTDLLALNQHFNRWNIDIISKIETPEAVDNLEGILEISNVMLARGDLLINTDLTNFYMLHNLIIDKVNKTGKRLYIATGIIPTLSYRYMPTHSELIDLGKIIESNPYGIILNADVAHGEYVDNAVNIIRNFKVH